MYVNLFFMLLIIKIEEIAISKKDFFCVVLLHVS